MVGVGTRYTDFTTLSRQHALPAPTDVDLRIAATGIALFDAAWTGKPVRLLGIGVSMLEDAPQLDLFDGGRDRTLDVAIDALRGRYGPAALRRGTGTGLQDLDFRGEDLRRLSGEPSD